MHILLDTNAYARFMFGHPKAVATVRSAVSVALNAIVLGELLSGFRRGNREAANREQLQSFVATYTTTLLPIGEETAERYAALLSTVRRLGRPIPTNDLWIAASALETGRTLVTADRHFDELELIPVILLT